MSIDLVRAIKSLEPLADFIVEDDVITWTDDSITEPTTAEINAEKVRLANLDNSLAYSRARKEEYSALNQFEMQFDDQQNNTTTWVDAINDIKARFPK
jgi:hypothetical protein